MAKLTPATVAAGALNNLVPEDRLFGPAGLTAVTGQALKLNGQPLRDVTLSIGPRSIRTDANGEFTLANVPAGHQILVIDGSSAGQGSHQYGRYEYGMDVIEGRTNPLPFVIWMSALDMKDSLAINSPTSGQTVVTNPDMPGLELRVPSGTVIRDAAGKIVTHISMTAIPTDQPPFPLPDFPVPVYFTVQPGGAHLEGSGGQVGAGAQLIYPNFTHSLPGTRMTFWNYDATSKGWYVYGEGSVTPDGTQVMPDPGVVIYEFSGAMVSLPSNAPASGPTPGGCKSGDPVDCFTGLFVNDEVDLIIPDVIPIVLRRTYRQLDNTSRGFGIGTNMGYDFFNVGTSNATSSSNYAYTYQDLILPDGAHIHYPRISLGNSYRDAVYQNTNAPGRFYGSIIKWIDRPASWSLTLKDGTTYVFPDSDGSSNWRAAAVTSIVDRNGNALTLLRDASGNLKQITSPNGRNLYLSYDGSNRVIQAKDDLGRIVAYSYDTSGRLVQVTDPLGHVEKFTYDSNNNMLTVTDRRGNVKVTNTYNRSTFTVSAQKYADGTTSSFAYTLNNGVVSQANFTDQRGVTKSMAFNVNGYATQVTLASGRPEQQVFTYNRNPATNLVNSVTDTLNRTTSFSYDGLGNLTQATWLSGTASAVGETIQYNATYSEPTQIVDPNGNATALAYDGNGNLQQVTDPLGHVASFTYDAQGRVLTAKDANGNTASLSYLGADLASIVSPLGNGTSFGEDLVGRLVSVSNPLLAQTTTVYDALDRVTGFVDANESQLQFGYDANGNVLTFTDADSHITSYSYDPLNRPLSRTDPLKQVESYTYEPGGMLSQLVDRKAQVSGATYDGLGRVTQIGFGATTKKPTAYTSTIAQTWDAGNRVTKIVDSVGGTITRTYDGLNRLILESTPQGSVTYTYDAGGRRTSMVAQGQPTVTYTWNTADHLVQLQQAAGTINGNTLQTVTFQYDNANRRTQAVFSNGVMTAYAYDVANELTGITYTQPNGTLIGTLTYTYDPAGHRSSVGGTLANVTVPAASFSGVYDANNRQTKLNGTTVTNDADGNTLNDGSNTYTWDARNQLTSLAGAANGSFKYDGSGRRVQKLIGSATTGFLYDGLNFTEEQSSSGAVTATLLTGGIDELFARMTSTGISVPLTDALGSVIAETNAAQVVTTNFAYDPYGQTTQTGTSSGNSQQYAARENDGTGLYFNRARYYNPKMGRFVSEDPIGFAGGPNTYVYAAGNPVSNVDPTGLDCIAVGSTVTCSPPGGPTISFPRPPGWPDYIGPNSFDYHSYNESANTAGTNSRCLEDYIRNHPTAGSPSPATPLGTGNDATPDYLSWAGPSPVLSYVTTSNGTQVVVNVTLPGHPLFPGYVARSVQSGPNNNQLNNYGEGLGLLQSPLNPFPGLINNVWQLLNDAAYEACSCQH